MGYQKSKYSSSAKTSVLNSNQILLNILGHVFMVKFIFSKKATKIDEIFTVDLTFTTLCQIDIEDFVKFLENINFKIKRESYNLE